MAGRRGLCDARLDPPWLDAFVQQLERLISPWRSFRFMLLCGRAHRGLGTAPQPGQLSTRGVRVRRWVSFHGVALNVSQI